MSAALSECGIWLLGLASCLLLLSHPRGLVLPNKDSIDHAIALRSPIAAMLARGCRSVAPSDTASDCFIPFSIVSESQLHEPARGTFLA